MKKPAIHKMLLRHNYSLIHFFGLETIKADIIAHEIQSDPQDSRCNTVCRKTKQK